MAGNRVCNNLRERRRLRRSRNYCDLIILLCAYVLAVSVEAFLTRSGHTPMVVVRSTINRYVHPSIVERARSTRLQIAKSGGKMIESEEQFARMVLSKALSRPVLVFFSAPWCGPCRLTVPVVKDVMKQYSDEIDVVEICTDDLAEVAEESGVTSIPTIQFYYGGSPLEAHSIVGCVAKAVLANAVEKVLEDVSQIRQSKRP